jgi:acetylornithine/succinyldiaminopimelate/putrescine aminotransferase
MQSPTATQTEDGYRLLKPRLCELLDLLRLGVAFHRASGDRLWFREKGREVEVLDLAGGFGSLLLGHNHPALVAEAQTILVSGRPIHAQGSKRTLAGRLARELSRRCGGDYRVVLANSGAEAVEAAMKHAMLETGARTFVALERAFHGKTLGAVQLTANAEVRDPFVLPSLEVARVRPNDLAHLEATFARLPEMAGFVYEPIQGEGGVRPLDDAFLERAAKLCAARGVPMIADEIQTGLGRTGTFLASPFRPDYLLLSKALGGGLAKISALLIRSDRHVADFDRLHTSTYAEDDFSSAIALKALELIDDLVIARCREKGERLLAALRRLQEKYPAVIADVRGRGLMVGLSFHSLPRSRSFLLRLLSAQDDLALVLAGYLFNVHRIRVLPTLSDPHTLRIEPSAFISEADLDRFVAAV